MATLILFTSCDNEQDPIFDDSPETRINNVLTKYKTTLTKDGGNWIAYYSGAAIYMTFKEDNTVEFKSTYGDGSDDRTVTYRVDITQVPELIFESHSVFHELYEDNLATGEYEFLFDKVADDRIDFISKTDKGSKKTKLTFFKGSTDDLAKAKALSDKVVVLSVFKEVVIAGETNYKMAIDLNPGGKARVTTLFEGKTVSVDYSYDVTATGIIFQPALSIGNGVKAAEFTFDETSQVFKSTDNDKVSINIVNEPILPLAPHKFGVRPGAQYNTLDAKNKSSLAFVNFFKGYTAVAGSDINLNWLLFKNLGLKGKVPYLYVSTSKGKFWFDFNYEIKEDGKLYITLTGDNNAGANLPLMQPLLDLFTSKKGHFIESTGTLDKYTNKTFSIINADNPAYRINFYEFG